jgi:DNA-directed RNA polymerase specialized sigma24 family protein
MPSKVPQDSANYDVEKYLQHTIPVIPSVIRKVCANLGHYPDQAEVDCFAQRIAYLLWKNDYLVLCAFKRESSPETWLFTIARRHILQWLRE